MKSILKSAIAAFGLVSFAFGTNVALAADAALPTYKSVASRAARLACNQYGRCWDASLMSYEDYNSGQLLPARRVNKRAGTCRGYIWQYPVAWDECAGDYNHGDGYIYH